jgi:hypothetical protein
MPHAHVVVVKNINDAVWIKASLSRILFTVIFSECRMLVLLQKILICQVYLARLKTPQELIDSLKVAMEAVTKYGQDIPYLQHYLFLMKEIAAEPKGLKLTAN